MLQPVILIDASSPEAQRAWTWGHEARAMLVESPGDVRQGLERAHSERAPLLIAQGDDAFLARVLTAHQRELAGQTHPLRVAAFSPEQGLVGEALGTPANLKKRARQLLKAAQHPESMKTSRLATLRLVSSARPQAQLAFSLGLGAMVDIQEASQRGQLAGAVQLGQVLARVAQERLGQTRAPRVHEAHIVIDGRPLAQGAAFVVASALPVTWSGLRMSRRGGARVLHGDQVSELARRAARARAPLAALQGEASAFEKITVNYLAQYVSDGDIVVPAEPFVLQVTAGPHVELVI